VTSKIKGRCKGKEMNKPAYDTTSAEEKSQFDENRSLFKSDTLFVSDRWGGRGGRIWGGACENGGHGTKKRVSLSAAGKGKGVKSCFNILLEKGIEERRVQNREFDDKKT